MVIEYELFLNKSIWPNEWILTSPTNMDLSEPGSNSNDGVFHTPELHNRSLTTRCSLISYSGHPFF